MVHFDRKNCENQAKNLGYKTEFGAKWFGPNCTTGVQNIRSGKRWVGLADQK